MVRRITVSNSAPRAILPTAVRWGLIAGALQALIALAVALVFPSGSGTPALPTQRDALVVGGVGLCALVMSTVISLGCGLIAARQSRHFTAGLGAAAIATGMAAIADVIGTLVNPVLSRVDLGTALASALLSNLLGLGLGALGAAIGALWPGEG